MEIPCGFMYIYINIYSYRYAGETLRMKGGKNLSTKKKSKPMFNSKGQLFTT